MEKEEKKLYCEWCGHKDKYMVGDIDQPICNKCGRFIPKTSTYN